MKIDLIISDATQEEAAKVIAAFNTDQKKRRVTLHGDLKIPFSTKTEDGQRKYDAAWHLCKAYGFITYPEVLRIQSERTADPAKPKKTNQQKESIQSMPSTDEQKESVKPPAGSTQQKKKVSPIAQKAAIPRQNSLGPGMKVRHTGSLHSPHFNAEGEVLKVTNDGRAYVKFPLDNVLIEQKYLTKIVLGDPDITPAGKPATHSIRAGLISNRAD